MIRVENKKGWYVVGEEEYISSTTVLSVISKGDGLLSWYGKLGFEKGKEIMMQKAVFGKKVHKCLELYLQGHLKSFDLQPEDVKKHLLGYQQWLEKVNLEIIDTERIVWSDTYRFAGTLDVVAKIKDDYVIIDFKTSSAIYSTYFLQLASYAVALWEREKIRISRLIVVRSDNNGEIEVQERNDIKKLFKVFLSAYVIYQFLHPRTALKIKNAKI